MDCPETATFMVSSKVTKLLLQLVCVVHIHGLTMTDMVDMLLS